MKFLVLGLFLILAVLNIILLQSYSQGDIVAAFLHDTCDPHIFKIRSLCALLGFACYLNFFPKTASSS